MKASLKNFMRAITLANILLFSLPITSAHALDIPVLSWEVGKEHNIQLQGYPGRTHWDIKLIPLEQSSPTKSLIFSPSSLSPQKKVTYSVEIPESFPLGRYSLVTSGFGVGPTEVAQIRILPLKYFQITEIPTDLFFVLGFYAFITAALSTLRSRRNSQLSYFSIKAMSSRSDQDSDGDPLHIKLDHNIEEGKELNQNLKNNYVEHLLMNNKDSSELSLGSEPYTSERASVRERWRNLLESLTENVKDSILKAVIVRERSHLNFLSPFLFSALPLFALLFGIGLSIFQLHEGGISSAPTYIYFIAALIPLWDLFSGFLTFSAFYLVQLFFGHPKSIREVMAIASLSIVIIGPAFIYSAINALVGNLTLSKGDKSREFTLPVSAMLAGSLGGFTFYVGLILCYSLHITVTGKTHLSTTLPLTLVLLLILKNLFFEQGLENKLEKVGQQQIIEEKHIFIGRVFSPLSALFLFLTLTCISFTWIESWRPALVVGSALSIPYIFMFINLSKTPLSFLHKVKRNWIVESFLILFSTLGVLITVEKLPLNVLQRSHYFIFLTLIPINLHAIYSAIWDGVDRELVVGSLAVREDLLQ